jgi:hypothetical protein
MQERGSGVRIMVNHWNIYGLIVECEGGIAIAHGDFLLGIPVFLLGFVCMTMMFGSSFKSEKEENTCECQRSSKLR